MNTQDPEWLKSLEAWLLNFVDFYETLTPEMEIWLWIAVAVGIAAFITGFILLFRGIIKALNNGLQSKEGWRPIRFYTCIWAGTAVSTFAIAYHMKIDEQSGWSVTFVIGLIILISYIWFMIKRLRVIKALGASAVNFSIGAILAPFVIYLSVLLILLVIALIALWIYSIFQPRTVYVRSYY